MPQFFFILYHVYNFVTQLYCCMSSATYLERVENDESRMFGSSARFTNSLLCFKLNLPSWALTPQTAVSTKSTQPFISHSLRALHTVCIFLLLLRRKSRFPLNVFFHFETHLLNCIRVTLKPT